MTTAISNSKSFYLEARYQRACAVCGSTTEWHAHHIVPRHLLRRLRLPEMDTRNALRLCKTCHMQFEWAGPGKVVIGIEHFPDQAVCYIWETLGVTAVQLEKKYGPFDGDERWEKHLRGECDQCQIRA